MEAVTAGSLERRIIVWNFSVFSPPFYPQALKDTQGLQLHGELDSFCMADAAVFQCSKFSADYPTMKFLLFAPEFHDSILPDELF